ncbi:MAG: sigma-70 family RNA polymerase sigma factor [Wenzhouxiangella sp.]|nr:MAG: sigma-70 family RNA polymerase sigma factor [Wenzhouxiangella sp.]
MPSAPEADLTLLLCRSADGDEVARDVLWTHIHDQLRTMASQRLARESSPQCDPTELVHEAFLKLDPMTLAPRDRQHFLALAARAMRQVLVDQARARRADKRGSGLAPVTLMTRHAPDTSAQPIDVLDLEHALAELEALDERKARAVELSYFVGLTDEEVAETLDISSATVKRDLRTARAWLASALGSDPNLHK